MTVRTDSYLAFLHRITNDINDLKKTVTELSGGTYVPPSDGGSSALLNALSAQVDQLKLDVKTIPKVHGSL